MNRQVSIGGPIALVVFGAIMYFALNAAIPGFEMKTIGMILMAAGAVWLVVGLILGTRSRGTVTRERAVRNGNGVDREISTEDR